MGAKENVISMPTDGTNQAQEPNNDEKITFTDKQQERVNELIRDAMGRAGREAKTEAETLKSELSSLRNELNEAKQTLSTAKTGKEKKDAQGDIEALQAQINEIQNAHKTVTQEVERWKTTAQKAVEEKNEYKVRSEQERKAYALRDAAQKINPFDVNDVVQATKDSVVWDEDKKAWSVINPENGQPRLNSGLYPMSLDEFFTEFAAKKPYLVRGSAKPGIGSSESGRTDVANNGKYTVDQIFGKNSNSKLAQQLAKQDIKEYHRLKAIARESGLIA